MNFRTVFYAIVAIIFAAWLMRSRTGSRPVEIKPPTAAEAEPSEDPLGPRSTPSSPALAAAASALNSSGSSKSPRAPPTPIEMTPALSSLAAPLPIAKSLPSLVEARKQIAQDPHTTPDAVVGFSIAIGERMDAVQSDADAEALFAEFEICVLKPAHPTTDSARSLCYLNARRLADNHRTLAARFGKLESATPTKIRDATRLLQ